MIVIDKFSGLITNASPYALPGGACVEQINLQCLAPGKIQGRAGMSQASTVGAGQVVAAVRFPTGATEQIVCQAGSQVIVVTV